MMSKQREAKRRRRRRRRRNSRRMQMAERQTAELKGSDEAQTHKHTDVCSRK